ncbi:16S rRNA (guanine(966)-N(2))-methyltransferase RsmD [Herbaspirillum sp. RTI4]|uniref:16S rRNA (guanine(966)-N(2))-methyltransferase RsmD n=1 Tax=Herbaspirillum sp. RTI4 TaxID=3048640 RepID=UPI002AB53C61|nr:16S rRNA (guanine(966)-N(2))-methyltransferase RsmD [Herbaspirillum sp. RTI4]MDY7577715.1 16S rRNA (guanine(966)-N(2))-methyltransferase RsmD [Herbaspirillum sp. RTI4]MEA9980857.1 16S rRNA (guanine(966)-N(2))-methyltransferase RsmD [Herbaspirillum sp. RTI4]
MKQASKKAPKQVPQHQAVQSHQVRIIGGQWKRTPLMVSAAAGLRPTPDRVRETVFNWLGHLLDGNWSGLQCLDLFAGSGALGFEAASRGAAQVTLVENSTPALQQLDAAKTRLNAQQVGIVRSDALVLATALAQRQPGSFDLVFVDPPYHQGWLEKIMPQCAQLLAPGGLAYVEAEESLEGVDAPEWTAQWEILRADRAGLVFYHLLRCKSAA